MNIIEKVKNFINKNYTSFSIDINNIKTNINIDVKENLEFNELEFIINIKNKYNEDRFYIFNRINKNNEIIFDNNLKNIFKINFINKNYQEVIEFKEYKTILTLKDIDKKYLPYDIDFFNVNKNNIEDFLKNYFNNLLENIKSFYIRINKKVNKLKEKEFNKLFKLKNLEFKLFNSFVHNEYIAISLYDEKVIYFKYKENIYYLVFFKNCINILNYEPENCNIYFINKIENFIRLQK